MQTRALRNRLTNLLNALDYDFSQFSIADFADWVAQRRGRPIQLMPREFPHELDGAWIMGTDADFVFYESSPPEIHSVHVLLHELSHMLLGHTTRHINDGLAGTIGSSGPPDEPEAQQTVLGLCRSVTHSDDQEVEAEALSSLIQQRVLRQAGADALARIGHDHGVRHFVHSMGFDR